MNDIPTLFDSLAAVEAREEAIAQVESNADPSWKKAASIAIRHLATERYEFTTDDVWELLHVLALETPREPRALGAMMRNASRDGLIDKTDRVRQSERPECHARPVAVWRSRVTDNR